MAKPAKAPVLLLLLFLCALVACGPGTPKDFVCRWDAERSIKQRLAFPSTYNEHLLLTSEMSQQRATITGDKESGWNLRTVMIFGTKNAFGVELDYLVWYDGYVDTNGECIGVRLGDFSAYTR